MSDIEYPLVSIVACCYNHEKFLEEALNSIIGQTYPNIQLIIMDDCSKDASVERIQEWIERNKVDCKFIAHQENKGVCATLNEALTSVKGDYYQMIACDDIMMPEKIERQVEVLKAYPNVAVVHSDASLIDDSSKLIQFSYNRYRKVEHQTGTIPSKMVFRLLIEYNSIIAPTALVRYSCVRRGEGHHKIYDESLLFEDLPLWLKLATSFDFYYLREQLACYRILDTSFSRSKKKIVDMETIKILESYYGINDGIDIRIRKKINNLLEPYYKHTLSAVLKKQTPLASYINKIRAKTQVRTKIKNGLLRLFQR